MTSLRVQALASLHRGPEARDAFKLASPGWLAAGLNRLAAVARLELAVLDARSGERDRARTGLAAARALLMTAFARDALAGLDGDLAATLTARIDARLPQL